MVMKEAWLQLVLNHLKTMELRGAPAPLGKTWLGCDGQVHGVATIVGCAIVTIEDFEATRALHRHLGDMPRYKKTYALTLQDVTPLPRCVDYYRLPATQPWAVFRTGPDNMAARAARRKRALESTQDVLSDGGVRSELDATTRLSPLPVTSGGNDTDEPSAIQPGHETDKSAREDNE